MCVCERDPFQMNSHTPLEDQPSHVPAASHLHRKVLCVGNVVRSSPPRIGVEVPILPTIPTRGGAHVEGVGNHGSHSPESLLLLFLFITLQPGVE